MNLIMEQSLLSHSKIRYWRGFSTYNTCIRTGPIHKLSVYTRFIILLMLCFSCSLNTHVNFKLTNFNTNTSITPTNHQYHAAHFLQEIINFQSMKRFCAIKSDIVNSDVVLFTVNYFP